MLVMRTLCRTQYNIYIVIIITNFFTPYTGVMSWYDTRQLNCFTWLYVVYTQTRACAVTCFQCGYVQEMSEIGAHL